ncbi:hypothetical protein [Lysinibacillus xylanilyticus]|uniref:Uncharacterized protein n=1 Tax=Lysinibacillus xylanilyticus TaxID=582475 RepID=A0ABT4ETC3_9BACI|nr:hypothetical protein [Lysinibacillus xylanilyticus]MCY9547516.1 hypothetical protein [Lysinibacillus xylanilyticus]
MQMEFLSVDVQTHTEIEGLSLRMRQFICAKAKRQQQCFNCAKAERQQQKLSQGEIDFQKDTLSKD